MGSVGDFNIVSSVICFLVGFAISAYWFHVTFRLVGKFGVADPKAIGDAMADALEPLIIGIVCALFLLLLHVITRQFGSAKKGRAQHA